MKRVAVLVLLLSGCGMRREVQPTQTEPTTVAEDQPLVQSYAQQQQSMLDELEHPAAAGHKPECPNVCALVANICSISGRICRVTALHDGDDDMQRACQDGLDRCTRARADAAGASCSCGG